MKLRCTAILLALVGSTLLSNCGGGQSGSGSGAAAGGAGGEVVDAHVRAFLKDTLGVFLDSLTHQFCRVREKTAPLVGQGNDICKDIFPDGYKPPPRNGGP